MGCSSSSAVSVPDRRPHGSKKETDIGMAANASSQPALLQGVAQVAPVCVDEVNAASSSSKVFLQSAPPAPPSATYAAEAPDTDHEGGDAAVQNPKSGKLARQKTMFPAAAAGNDEEEEEDRESPQDAVKNYWKGGLQQKLKPLCPPWRGTYEVPRGFSVELEKGSVVGGSSSSSCPSTAAGNSPALSGKTSNGSSASGSGGSPGGHGPQAVYAKLMSIADIVVASERPAGSTFGSATRRTKDACPGPWNGSLVDCKECNECDSIWAQYCTARPDDVNVDINGIRPPDA